MASQRGTILKRQREMALKDRARAKDERRAQKKNEVHPKGPVIAWDEAVQMQDSSLVPPPADAAETADDTPE